MLRYKITVTEIPSDVAVQNAAPDIEIFKIVVDQFDAARFTKAITAQPRRRKKQVAA